MIRLPEIPNVAPAETATATPSASAVGAPARALEDVSRGLATVGSALTSEALRLQQIENARRESEIRQGWQQALADLNTRLATETDPTRIPQLTEQLIANLSGTVEDDSLPPALRDRLNNQFLQFSTGATIRAGEQASRLAITRARHAFENETQAAIRTHDRDALENAITTASDAFGLLPEQADSIRTDFERNAELDLLDLATTELPDELLQYDPEEFRRVYPHLNRNDLNRAQSAARREIQNQRTTEFDTLYEALYEGNLTPEQIENAERLTARDKQRLKSALTREDGAAIDPAAHAQAWDILLNLREKHKDPSISDAEYAALWNDARAETTSMLPPDAQGDIRQELSHRSPANRRGGSGNPAANLPSNAANKSEGRALITRAFNEGLFGDPDEWSAFNTRQDLHIALDQYLQQNPGTSWQQTRQWLQSQIGLTATESAPIIPFAPPATSGIPLDQIDGLLEGSLLPPKPGTPGALPNPTAR